MLVGSPIESGFFSSSTPLSLMPERFSKRKNTKRRDLRPYRSDMFLGLWLTCNLVMIALVKGEVLLKRVAL
jgi:hypothetical protein